MRRILQRHGIQHANTAEHIESLPDDGPLHNMTNALSQCLRTWFAPGESYYIPMSSTNWGLQKADPSADADHLTIKRIAFMNAGRHLQDARCGTGKVRGVRRRSLISNLAFHSRSYAASLYDFMLRHPLIAQFQQHLRQADCHPLSLLTFRWTRVDTDYRYAERLCEYATQGALDECILAWCTAVATQLTLGQYEEAATSAHIMSGMIMKITATSTTTTATASPPVASHTCRHYINAFSPPFMDLPCALVVTVRDAVALLRDVVGDTGNGLTSGMSNNATTHSSVAKGIMVCFGKGVQLRCIPLHVRKLLGHCEHVLCDCEAFLSTRELLQIVRERAHQRDRGHNYGPLQHHVPEHVRTSYRKLQERGIEGCSDYVVAEMAKLDIALFTEMHACRE